MRLRVIPRMIAKTIANPTDADTKFCTARPSICVRWLIVTSPEYHCQFVLVTKLTAVFHAPVAPTASRSVGLNGSTSCRRCNA